MNTPDKFLNKRQPEDNQKSLERKIQLLQQLSTLQEERKKLEGGVTWK